MVAPMTTLAIAHERDRAGRASRGGRGLGDLGGQGLDAQ